MEELQPTYSLHTLNCRAELPSTLAEDSTVAIKRGRALCWTRSCLRQECAGAGKPERAELTCAAADTARLSVWLDGSGHKKKRSFFSGFQTAIGAETVRNEPPAAASASRMKTVAHIFTVLIKQITITIHKYLRK